MLDVVLQQACGITPAVSIDIGRHGAVDPVSERFSELLGFAVVPKQEVKVGQLGHVQVSSRQLDIPSGHSLLESFFLLGRSALQKSFHGPERFACPSEGFPLRAFPAVGGFRNLQGLADKIGMVLFDSLLTLRIADIRVGMVDDKEGPGTGGFRFVFAEMVHI
ncbi:hypothetical protein D3C74_298250 [compost metagenome]